MRNRNHIDIASILRAFVDIASYDNHVLSRIVKSRNVFSMIPQILRLNKIIESPVKTGNYVFHYKERVKLPVRGGRAKQVAPERSYFNLVFRKN